MEWVDRQPLPCFAGPSTWLTLELPVLFTGVDVTYLAPLTVLVQTGDDPATIELRNDGVAMNVGAPASSEQVVVVEGEPEDVFALLTGTGNKRNRARASVRGPRDAVRRLHRTSHLVVGQRHSLLGRRDPFDLSAPGDSGGEAFPRRCLTPDSAKAEQRSVELQVGSGRPGRAGAAPRRWGRECWLVLGSYCC